LDGHARSVFGSDWRDDLRRRQRIPNPAISVIPALAGSGTLANVGKDNPLAAAILSSLTSTCRRHNIDPQLYLTQLLTNLPATPMSQIEQWLPDDWKRRNPTPSG
jgi:hypothetical protein